MPRHDAPRIAILGAGPVGLEALLYAQALHLPAVVYERGRVGEYLHRWGHVRLFSPFGLNTTPLGRQALRADNPRHEFPADGDCVTGREHLAAYLEPLARLEAVRPAVRTQTEVLHIGRRGCLKDDDPGDARRARQPFRLIVREGNKERAEEADVVLDCTGAYGKHRWLGDGGVPALGEVAAEAQIAYGLEDVLGERRQHYAGRHVLVVGSGYSAATAVCNLATLAEKHMETWVTWLARGPSSQPLRRIPADPLRERDQLAMRANNLATRAEGNVRFLHEAVVEAVEPQGPDKGFRVRGRVAGKPTAWNVERLVANVGYTPDAAIYRELQVHECYASLGPMKLAAALAGQRGGDCLKQAGHGPEALRNPEPNFFILGAKSYGRNAHFLLRQGFEQVRDVFTLLTGKASLDLYGKRPRMTTPLPLLETPAPVVPLAHLDELWFQVAGTLCNLECTHCFISCGPHNRSFGMLTLDAVRAALEESVGLGVKEYYFTGGEPFLHPDMVPILELTLRYGPATVLTNGTVLRDEWLARLRRAEEASPYSLEFRVSLDGPTARENDPVRGAGTFARTLRGVGQLVAHGFLPIVTVTRTRDDQDDADLFEVFVRLLRGIGYERPRVKLLPTLRLGAEVARQRGYRADERVTPEMMEGYDAGRLLCDHARVVSERGVHVCPILLEAPDARLGATLREGLAPYALRHHACYTCYQYGALCANPSGAGRDA